MYLAAVVKKGKNNVKQGLSLKKYRVLHQLFLYLHMPVFQLRIVISPQVLQ